MNLYDIMGPAAIALGIGGFVGYARGEYQSGVSIAAALLVGIIVGTMTFLTIRKVVYGLEKPTERVLMLLYLATFFGVLVATCVGAFGTLAIAEG